MLSVDLSQLYVARSLYVRNERCNEILRRDHRRTIVGPAHRYGRSCYHNLESPAGPSESRRQAECEVYGGGQPDARRYV